MILVIYFVIDSLILSAYSIFNWCKCIHDGWIIINEIRTNELLFTPHIFVRVVWCWNLILRRTWTASIRIFSSLSFVICGFWEVLASLASEMSWVSPFILLLNSPYYVIFTRGILIPMFILANKGLWALNLWIKSIRHLVLESLPYRSWLCCLPPTRKW